MLLSIGLLLGLYLSLYILPLIPGAIDFLSNKPNRKRPAEKEGLRARDYKPSNFGFFTYLHPGQVKVIERGGRFIRCIMAYDRHMFRGERSDNDLTPKHADYWEIVKTESPYYESHPIPFPIVKHDDLLDRPEWLLYSPLSILWWVWKRWVYLITGAVFTGLPLYQGPRVYPMERFNRVTDGDGKVALVRREDYSDHYRVSHFQYPAKIARADTQDKIPVDVLLNEIAAVFNPYLVAYRTDDDWPTRFLGSVSNRVTLFTRPRALEDVLTAKNLELATELADFITLGGKHIPDKERESGVIIPEGSTCLIGIKILESQVLDISPSNASDEKDLGKEALAKVQRKADEEFAKGKAAYIREEGEALKAHPYADIVVQTEGMVRAAEAAGKSGGIVILSGGQPIDPIQAATLKELRDRREQQKKRSNT